MVNWSQESVLVTGGTGSFGKKFAEIMLQEYHPHRLVIFSRDELKQHEMQESGFKHPSLRYFIGDVRDVDRLKRALNPINLYGATKLCAEKMFVQANAYAGTQDTRFSCARYGNVVGSRGSVIPIFIEQRKRGKITITDPRMTRFWLTLEHGVRFVISCLDQMHGGEIFVPKIPSMRLLDLAETIAPACEVECIGIRPGEKLHEVLVSDDESRNTLETEEMFVIQPVHPWWKSENWLHARRLPEGFRYSSDTNERWLTRSEFTAALPCGRRCCPTAARAWTMTTSRP